MVSASKSCTVLSQSSSSCYSSAHNRVDQRKVFQPILHQGVVFVLVRHRRVVLYHQLSTTFVADEFRIGSGRLLSYLVESLLRL